MNTFTPVAWRFWHEGGWNVSTIDPHQHLVEGEIQPLYARLFGTDDMQRIEREILHDDRLWSAKGQGEIEAAVVPLAARITASLSGNAGGRIAETFNEHGMPVTLFRCGSCWTTFTVCPAVKPEHDDQWRGCMAEGCASYDESRDGDKLFDAGKARRVGDRSHLKVVD